MAQKSLTDHRLKSGQQAVLVVDAYEDSPYLVTRGHCGDHLWKVRTKGRYDELYVATAPVAIRFTESETGVIGSTIYSRTFPTVIIS